MKKISEGAEADIYAVKLFGLDAVFKLRRQKPYIQKELDESIRQSRTKTEARLLEKASSVINAPRPIFVTRYGIAMEKLPGTPGSSSALSEKDFREAGEALAKLHNLSIVHGDFTPANMLVGKHVSIIDFGLACVSSSAEDKAFDLLLMKRAISAKQYKVFISAYIKHCKNSSENISKLASIERRGRYQSRTLDAGTESGAKN